jgi:hypothetical protein
VRATDYCTLGNPSYRCALERAMIRSPLYDKSLQIAFSMGRLSVRLVGSSNIRVGCTLSVWDMCISNSTLLQTPHICEDTSTPHDSRWNLTKRDKICNPQVPILLHNRCSPLNVFPSVTHCLLFILITVL